MQEEIKLNFEKFLNEGSFSNSEKQFKEENFKKFFIKGFPNKRLEDWKFSDLNQIILSNFKDLNFINKENDTKSKQTLINNFEHNKIIFINSKLDKTDFSHENEEDISIEKEDLLDEKSNDNVLLNLNAAFLTNYAKIIVKKNYQFQKPLIIYNFLTDNLDQSCLNIRLDIDVEENASLNVINISNDNAKNNFINFRQKINVGKNSIFKSFSLDVKQESNFKYTFNDINLANNSHLEYFILSKGSKFNKQDINCSLNGEYGSAVINGIIDLNDEKHHEIKTVVNHNEENCKSYQLIKSVLNDNSKGIYQGKIYVNSKAQKTDGYQLSRALLLNDNVEFNAKPELEIYADDVKCSHGSTSGNIDENSIFYLMSRGLSYDQSKKLLTNGFLNEVIEKITNEDIKNLVNEITGIQK